MALTGSRTDGEDQVCCVKDQTGCQMRMERLHAETLIALSIPLSLNHATQEELSYLKGVSTKRAQFIVEGRPWRSVEELTTIKGIGLKTLSRFSHLLSAQPPKVLYTADSNDRLSTIKEML